tara:strand:+ start:6519 stop:7883 length:1365 start_codon:yes stop_codon:yes gene_type:complete
MGGALAIFLFLTAFPYLGIDLETNEEIVSIDIEKRKKVVKKESAKVMKIIKQSKKNNQQENNKPPFQEFRKYISLLNSISGKTDKKYCSNQQLYKVKIEPEISALLTTPKMMTINSKSKRILKTISKEGTKNILASNSLKNKIMGDYMQLWSYEYQWNRVRYEEIVKAYLKSFQEIKNHFSIKNKMPGQEASLHSINLLNKILSTNTNSYPKKSNLKYLGMFAPVKKILKDPIYLSISSQIIDSKEWIEQANSLFDKSIFNKRSTLKIALLSNQPLEIIEWLIKEGALKEKPKYKEETPIFYAIHSPLFTKLILKNQENAKISNHFNKSALHYSIQFENEETTKLLLDHGFNINQKTTQIAKWPECSITSKLYNLTPIMYAANHNKTDKIIILLLNSGAQTNHKDSINMQFTDYLQKNKKISQNAKKRILEMIKKSGKVHLGKKWVTKNKNNKI